MDYLTKTPTPGMRKLSFEFSSVVQENPKALTAIAVALDYYPEVDSKTLLLKTPCTSDPGPKGSELDLT